ncbi:MAG: iron-sulfur cluster assembly accessory protein [Acidobacteria bacterium]|nr:iron-sulfur cluster assembly accessory protein [Acidobacteriota bacterium]
MIQLTESAKKKIRQVVEQQQSVAGLRLGVRGGGCDGLTYLIEFDAAPRAKDNVFEYDGVKLFVDPKSLVYLQDMTVDYKETLMQQGFVFENPKAKHSCSCGTSFSV